jgi:RimJ/RimL family protein N-acetyltransferase
MDLQPFTEADIPDLLGWFSDEAALMQWGGTSVSFPLTASQFEPMLTEARRDVPRLQVLKAVADGKTLGHLQIVQDWLHGVARFGLVGIRPEYRGRGFARSMLRCAQARVFASAVFQRLELQVYTQNAPAVRAYESVGFVREGVRRSALQIGKERWDIAFYAILRAEYEAGSSVR